MSGVVGIEAAMRQSVVNGPPEKEAKKMAKVLGAKAAEVRSMVYKSRALA